MSDDVDAFDDGMGDVKDIDDEVDAEEIVLRRPS